MAQNKIKAPIDRPLSRSYLREFKGWSTAYPPELSDPATLRIMENVLTQRDGAVSIRPGMRYLIYDETGTKALDKPLVGTHEPFFLNDGTRALLFAVRETISEAGGSTTAVTFKAAVRQPAGHYVTHELDSPEVGFTLVDSLEELRFSEATTYVKYLQIDNQVFALSNAGEPMRLFSVGESKEARRVYAVDRPHWSISDKLSVIHPDASWIDTGSLQVARRNLVTNPSFELNLDGWSAIGTMTRLTGQAAQTGSSFMQLHKDLPPGSLAQATTTVTLQDEVRDYRVRTRCRKTNGNQDTHLVIFVSWLNSSGNEISNESHDTRTVSGSWADYTSTTLTAPKAAKTARLRLRIPSFNYANTIFQFDSVIMEDAGTNTATYFDGDTPDTATKDYQWAGPPHASESLMYESLAGHQTTIAVPEDPTPDTLISSTGGANTYNFGYFYTFSNHIGESPPSKVTIQRAQRPWPSWEWETPNAAGEPSGTRTSDPESAADQLLAFMPEEVFDDALDQGAISWSLYMFTWSDQEPVPIQAVRVGTQELDSDSVYTEHGWIKHTPDAGTQDVTAPVPGGKPEWNFSDPGGSSQGLVAADRIVLVNDPVNQSVIRWSSNKQGSYTDFSSSRGGGYKTLTSGNLYVPAAVKLWQNPQSTDTLTILCRGVDGQSSGYYMQPAEVSSQASLIQVMAFEETSATPGTTSPYGCEVVNSTLYHPLDQQLMKSVAANYRISHKSETDLIAHDWSRLLNKHRIVSSVLEERIYYIVHNPDGEPLEDGCMGNEIWVLDVQPDGDPWSRYLIQANALRKVEVDGRVYMSVVRPDGAYYLDPDYDRDDTVNPDLTLSTRFIPWRIESNTQGANRAHDAWCNLQQAMVGLGNFTGTMEYGITGYDVHGRAIDRRKRVHDLAPVGAMPYDIEDFLLIQREFREWRFFAGSVDDGAGVLQSFGQINEVQYRYTSTSVNVGYEYGSVETFEYGRAEANPTDPGNTIDGVPVPMTNRTRP